MGWQGDKEQEARAKPLASRLDFLRRLICMMPRQMGHWSPAFQIMQNSQQSLWPVRSPVRTTPPKLTLGLLCDTLHPCLHFYRTGAWGPPGTFSLGSVRWLMVTATSSGYSGLWRALGKSASLRQSSVSDPGCSPNG